jgi:hypothetical protein
MLPDLLLEPQASPGVIPTAMKLTGFAFGTTAQYSPKKPGTGFVVKSGIWFCL